VTPRSSTQLPFISWWSGAGIADPGQVITGG
jgi:hypothetical protein